MAYSLYRLVVDASYEHIPLTTVGSLNTVSHALEDVALVSGPQTDLAVGFQRWSRFMPQFERYAALATVCRSMYLYGLDDLDPPQLPHVTFVPLKPHWPLAAEWFVVVRAPGLRAALIAEELPTANGQRQFRACFSADPAAVDHCFAQLGETLPAPVLNDDPFEPEIQRQNLDLVRGRLITHQEQRLIRAVEQQRKAAEHAAEIRELVSLMPQFADHTDWQNLLAAHVRRAANKLY